MKSMSYSDTEPPLNLLIQAILVEPRGGDQLDRNKCSKGKMDILRYRG